MIGFDRPDAPAFLKNQYKAWGRRYAERRTAQPNASFTWVQYQGTPCNHLILEALEPLTQNHCAFCDAHALGVASRQTIEHFRPKSTHPHLAYAWANLFLCCDVCQQAKGDTFSRLLLKPDVLDYRFERYFIYRYRTGEILPNPAASPAEQTRAAETIEVFKLNTPKRKWQRRHEHKRGLDTATLDEVPYRFIYR